jgi:hypothetical protein
MADATAYPRVILFEGDPFLTVTAVTRIKKDRFGGKPSSSEWIEFDVQTQKQEAFMKDTLNKIDGEISYPSWDGGQKVVVIRGLVNTKQFRQVMSKFVGAIPDGTTLVVLDVDGVIMSEKGDGEGSWKHFRKLCRQFGEVVNVGVPISKMTRDAQAGFIVDQFATRSKTVSGAVSELMLSMCLPDRGFIISEIEKVCDFVGDGEVTEKVIDEVVFPIAPEYQFFAFQKVLYCGGYVEIMQITDGMVSGGIPYEVLIDQVVKATRWQLVAAHLMTYNRNDLSESFWRCAKAKDPLEFRASLIAKHALPMSAFGNAEETDTENMKKRREKQEVSDFIHRLVMDSMAGILKAATASKPKDSKAALCRFAMERFLTAKEAVVRMRLARENGKREIFSEVIRDIKRRRI